MVDKTGCGFCSAEPKKCMDSLRALGDNKYQCFRGHVIDLDPFINTPLFKNRKAKIKVDIYKVEVFIEDYSQQPVPLLGHGRLTHDVRLVNDELQAMAMIQKAKEIAHAMFKPKESELEERFYQDDKHVVEAEYFVDNHEGPVGELFAIYSHI